MPGPDPALRKFDRFVGTWEMKGRTLDSGVDNITARTTFEWLPGGHFLLQRFSADFVGMDIQSHEVIGFDPATGTFMSTVYSNMAPMPLPYRWAIDGDELTIKAEASARRSGAAGMRMGPCSRVAGDPIPATRMIPATCRMTSRVAAPADGPDRRFIATRAES